MKTALRCIFLGLLALLGMGSGHVQAHGRVGLSIGLGFGVPVYPRPWCGWGYYGYYYRPYPIYVAPPPVYVASTPVVVEQAPVVPPVYAAPPRTVQPVSATVAADPRQTNLNRHLALLADPDDRVRSESVTQLGRSKAERVIDPLAATLAGDRSPAVREAAARALGIIGSPRGLPALERAAQADPDHDVRRSAQFAVEVIQSRQ